MICRSFQEVELELRGVSKRRLGGSIKYRSKGVLRSGAGRGGSERALGEVLMPKVFDFTLRAVKEGKEDVKLLAGHDASRPLATAASDTLELKDTDDALEFEAELVNTTAADDVLELIRSGVATGTSFGFYLPPVRRVPRAVTMVQEPVTIDGVRFEPPEGAPGADIRVVHAAILREISVGVTFPVYRENDASLRSEGYLWDVPATPKRRALLFLP